MSYSFSASLLLISAACLSGCYNPYMNYGNPYMQPGYAPPQTLNPGAPGTLIIPQSDAPMYDPAQTYDDDIDDDFEKSGSGSFYGTDSEEGVPRPRDLENGSKMFDSDLGGPGVNTGPPQNNSVSRPVGAPVRSVSSSASGSPYGFDADEYRWLRGILRYDQNRRLWNIVYSLQEDDLFRGNFYLVIAPDQVAGLRPGDTVDLRGEVLHDPVDYRGRPMYRVASLQKTEVRISR